MHFCSILNSVFGDVFIFLCGIVAKVTIFLHEGIFKALFDRYVTFGITCHLYYKFHNLHADSEFVFLFSV